MSALSLKASSNYTPFPGPLVFVIMDGVGIGLAFQVSNAVGIVVAVAVIAHDFCDGLNTVGLMLLSYRVRDRDVQRRQEQEALRWRKTSVKDWEERAQRDSSAS